MMVKFSKVKVNQEFQYDGDTYKKTSQNHAYEIRNGEVWLEWRFKHGDEVEVEVVDNSEE